MRTSRSNERALIQASASLTNSEQKSKLVRSKLTSEASSAPPKRCGRYTLTYTTSSVTITDRHDMKRIEMILERLLGVHFVGPARDTGKSGAEIDINSFKSRIPRVIWRRQNYYSQIL
jgi:hypothetical protein